MKKYSIWLDVSNKNLEKQILSLSQKYNTPSFKPHITLLGALKNEDMDVLGLFENWLPSCNSFSFKLGTIDASNTYFQCLFYNIIPNLELLELRKEAEQHFKKHYAYFPHLSLLYADIPIKERIQLTNSIITQNTTIKIESLSLINTSGHVEKWEVISNKKLL